MRVTLVILAIAIFVFWAPAAQGQITEEGLQGPREDQLSGSNLLSNSYRGAWRRFAIVNRPMERIGRVRTAAGSVAVRQVRWETWANNAETFPDCPNAAQPPIWPSSSFRPKTLTPRTQSQSSSLLWYTLEDGEPTAVEVEAPQEVRRNWPTFQYIADHGLYFREGLAAAYQRGVSAALSTDRTPNQAYLAMLGSVNLPASSLQVLASWVPLEHIPEDQRDDYYTSWAFEDGEGLAREVALVAMHVKTNEVPNWFFATWTNKHVLGRCDAIGCRDTFGLTLSYIPPNEEDNHPYPEGEVTPQLIALLELAGLDEVWRNYRLVGVQADYLESTGQPILIGNTLIEQGALQTSSCISCHARAATRFDGTTVDITSDAAASATPPVGDVEVTDNGSPDLNLYWSHRNDQEYFYAGARVEEDHAVQLDFTWGFLNAKSIHDCP